MRTLPERKTGRVFRAVAGAKHDREPVRFVQESGPHGFGWGLHIHLGRGGAAVFGRASFDPDDTNEVARPDLTDPETIDRLRSLAGDALAPKRKRPARLVKRIAARLGFLRFGEARP